MNSAQTPHSDLFGRESSVTTRWLAVALGLFLVAIVYGFVAEFVSQSVATRNTVLYLVVILGVCLAVVSAYQNRGLVVSWLLVGAPVGGAMLFEMWTHRADSAGYVALPLSFYGRGALAMWVPIIFLVGVGAFCLGVIGRWMVDSVGS